MRTAGHGEKTSRAQQRCGRLWAETEAKTNPAGPREATRPGPLASPGSQGPASAWLLSRISNSGLCADGLYHKLVCLALRWKYHARPLWSKARVPVVQPICWVTRSWQFSKISVFKTYAQPCVEAKVSYRHSHVSNGQCLYLQILFEEYFEIWTAWLHLALAIQIIIS